MSRPAYTVPVPDMILGSLKTLLNIEYILLHTYLLLHLYRELIAPTIGTLFVESFLEEDDTLRQGRASGAAKISSRRARLLDSML
ncbi:unnamed protein product [Brassica napus]|uniref:(rape) hypothetical protein n=1 Tax=Brassica napus TaxID=3708 RepID=A0A816SDY3_BRANA|nr:unnamed protein product [Brassica napus]